MTTNNRWLRFCRLVVATDEKNEEALDLSDFRVVFSISQATVGKPCTAEITIYNVAPETVNQIQVPTNERSTKRLRVILDAGYEGQHGVIFEGDLWWKSVGRENETDTFMRLVASTGDRSHRYAVVSTSLRKGASQEQIFGAIAQSMAEKGVPENKEIASMLAVGNLPRGKVVYKMAADAMQDLADTNGIDWYYGSKGLIAVRKDGSYNPNDDVIVLTSETGLIGRPMMTVDGVEAQCLLDSRIDVGSLVQIDNRSIQRQIYNTDTKANIQANEATTDSMISADGLYRVLGREHHGDNRGTQWYTTLICAGVNSAVKPISTTSLNNIPNL